jgi:hypothetical protein
VARAFNAGIRPAGKLSGLAASADLREFRWLWRAQNKASVIDLLTAMAGSAAAGFEYGAIAEKPGNRYIDHPPFAWISLQTPAI